MRLRAALLAILFVPLALATSTSSSDPAGDVETRFAGAPSSHAKCEDDAIDLVQVQATSDLSEIRFFVDLLDRAAAPSCAIEGILLPTRAGAPQLVITFGAPYAEPYAEISLWGERCFAELLLDGHFAQPDCTLAIDDDRVAFAINAFGWTVHEEEGYLEGVDYRALAWPADGDVHAYRYLQLAPVGPALQVSDHAPLLAFDP